MQGQTSERFVHFMIYFKAQGEEGSALKMWLYYMCNESFIVDPDMYMIVDFTFTLLLHHLLYLRSVLRRYFSNVGN